MKKKLDGNRYDSSLWWGLLQPAAEERAKETTAAPTGSG